MQVIVIMISVKIEPEKEHKKIRGIQQKER